MRRSIWNSFGGLLATAALIGLAGAGAAAAQTPARIDAASPGVTIGPDHPAVTVPVTISRDGTTPLLGFSVRIELSSEFSALTITGSDTDVALGNFLTDNGRATSLQVVNDGPGVYTIDGVTLGSDCGPPEQTGTLFTVRLRSPSGSGTGTVTMQSVTLRDCSNQPVAASIGSSASVSIDNTPPTVTVSAPNGGEKWTYGSSHPVTWTATDDVSVAAIDLAYSTDGGATFPYTIATGIGNTGSYAWTAPVVASTAVRVRATAHDANGNSAADMSDANFTIQCPTVTLSETHVNVSCFGGSNGSIDLSVSGGAPPYSYAWGDGPTTEDRSGLSAGTYTVTVTDANGCTASTSVTVTEPTSLSLGETHTGTCVGSPDGTIMLTVSGGTAPYSFLWNNGATTQNLSGLAAGNDSVTVTDANNCTGGLSVVIAVRAYTIAASAGANGAIAPSGSVSVDCGTNETFTITPNAGYHVGVLAVDGANQPVVPSVMTYTFTSVTANHTIDAQFTANPVVPGITAVQVSQVTSGNDGDGTIKLRVHWGEAIPSTSTVEVYRARFGHYPEYDDQGGANPILPTTPPAPGGAWELTGVTASDQTDEVSNGSSGYAGRDVWYYVAFVKDIYGTYSPVSNMSVGRPNYLLGDVSDGTIPGLGRGNNRVDGADISALGDSYGLTGAAMAAVNYLDVGPTTDHSVSGRPLTDNAIDFEDLVIFAINFGIGPQPQLVATAARTEGQVASDRLTTEMPSWVKAGEEFTVPLRLDGSGRVQALSTALDWDKAAAQPIGIAAGEWLTRLNGVAFSPRPGVADVALLGRGTGFAGEGVVAEVRFRALATGEPHVRMAAATARDGANQDVALATSVTSVKGPIPTVTMLSAAYPNPFHNSTTIDLSLARPGQVSVLVYALDGRLVRTLASGRRDSGVYHLEWNGRDDLGQALSSGIYFVQMSTPQSRSVKKVSFVR